MKTQQQVKEASAYDEGGQGALRQNLNIQNKGKLVNKSNISTNVDPNMSSSLISEKLDKRHVINLSTGN